MNHWIRIMNYLRDETFEVLLGYHRTIFQYILVILDGFKDVLEDVSVQKIVKYHFYSIILYIYFYSSYIRLKLIIHNLNHSLSKAKLTALVKSNLDNINRHTGRMFA